MFGEVTVMFYFVVHHVGALARTYCSCSAFDRCFLQSYQESYEAGKELAHGDVITVTYELDAEDECEITMYLGVSVPHIPECFTTPRPSLETHAPSLHLLIRTLPPAILNIRVSSQSEGGCVCKR